jgi:hypothetical protein
VVAFGRERDSVGTIVSTESWVPKLREGAHCTFVEITGASGSINCRCATLHLAQWRRQSTACAGETAVKAGRGHVQRESCGGTLCNGTPVEKAWMFPGPGTNLAAAEDPAED